MPVGRIPMARERERERERARERARDSYGVNMSSFWFPFDSKKLRLLQTDTPPDASNDTSRRGTQDGLMLGNWGHGPQRPSPASNRNVAPGSYNPEECMGHLDVFSGGFLFILVVGVDAPTQPPKKCLPPQKSEKSTTPIFTRG